MKRCVIGLWVVLWVAGPSLWAENAKMMSVQNQSSTVREKPTSMGKVLATVSYGDRLQVLETKSGWMRVSGDHGLLGWIHASALTSQKLALKAGQSDTRVSASGDELALAGKGFNPQVEKDFKDKHKDLDFASIDRMVKIRVSNQDMQTFLQNGGVTPKEGAQ